MIRVHIANVTIDCEMVLNRPTSFPRSSNTKYPTLSQRTHRNTVLHPPPYISANFRARQRTFEAAYWRTSLGQFSFALIILKFFQDEFYTIGGIASMD